jgi:RpiR family carbohydrate utilization transcriptional regulator
LIKIEKEIKNKSIELNVLFKLKSMESNLRDSERKVLNYILNNPSKIIDMTISEVAKNANSSEATVVRTCKNLDFRGFKELQFLLKRDIEEALNRVLDEVKENEPVDTIVKKVFNSNAKAIENTLNTIDILTFEQALTALKKAKNIAFFAQGGSSSIALNAYHKFININKNCLWQADANMQLILVNLLSKGDACIAISRSGEIADVVNATKLAHKKGAFCIAITAKPQSSLTKVADVTLYSCNTNSVFKNIDIAEQIVAITIFDALYISLANSDIQKTKNALRIAAEATSLRLIKND